MNIGRNILLCGLVWAICAAIVAWVHNEFVIRLLMLVMGAPIFLAVTCTIDIIKYGLRGYAIYSSMRHESLFYRERGKGAIEFGFYNSVVEIPPAESWRGSVPDWAVDQRPKIVARIKKEFRRDKSIRVPD